MKRPDAFFSRDSKCSKCSTTDSHEQDMVKPYAFPSEGATTQGQDFQGATTVLFTVDSLTLSLEIVRDELSDRGFAGLYDFLYLPPLRSSRCMSLAFVNFLTSRITTMFMRSVSEQLWMNRVWHDRPIRVELAKVQGFHANVALYSQKLAENPGQAGEVHITSESHSQRTQDAESQPMSLCHRPSTHFQHQHGNQMVNSFGPSRLLSECHETYSSNGVGRDAQSPSRDVNSAIFNVRYTL